MTQPYPPPGQPQWMPPPQGYGPPPPPPRKKRVWPWIAGGVVAMFVLAGVAGGGDEQATQNRPGTPSGVTSDYNAQPAAPLKAADEPAPAASSGPKTSFGDGTWVVGEDIVPGTYKTGGAVPGMFEYCQITTHSDPNAESSVLDWKNGNADEPIRVKLDGKVKSVKATGCEDFVKVG